jgi:hypothetical protein
MTFPAMIGMSLTILATAAGAVPPPPPPAGYVASWKAIDALDPFLGRWKGAETQHGRYGDSKRSAYRLVTRPSGRDLLLLESGTFPFDAGKPFPEAFDVIVFDVATRRYKAFLPGYREFTGDEQTAELVEVTRPAPDTLVWSASAGPASRRRTTVTISGNQWRERIEAVAPDGTAKIVSDLTLEREAPPVP